MKEGLLPERVFRTENEPWNSPLRRYTHSLTKSHLDFLGVSHKVCLDRKSNPLKSFSLIQSKTELRHDPATSLLTIQYKYLKLSNPDIF